MLCDVQCNVFHKAYFTIPIFVRRWSNVSLFRQMRDLLEIFCAVEMKREPPFGFGDPCFTVSLGANKKVSGVTG